MTTNYNWNQSQEIEKKVCSICKEEKIKVLEFPKGSSYCKDCLHKKTQANRMKNKIGIISRGWKDSNWTIWNKR